MTRAEQTLAATAMAAMVVEISRKDATSPEASGSSKVLVMEVKRRIGASEREAISAKVKGVALPADVRCRTSRSSGSRSRAGGSIRRGVLSSLANGFLLTGDWGTECVREFTSRLPL